MGGLIRDTIVYRDFSRPLVLADGAVEAEQDNGKLTVERGRVINGRAARDGDCVEVRLEDGARLIVEHGALNYAVVKRSVFCGQSQCECSVAVRKTRLILAELSELGTAGTGTRLAGQRGAIDLSACDGKRDGRHFAHRKRRRESHFDMIAGARSVGRAGAAIVQKGDRGAADSRGDLYRGRRGPRLDIIDRSFGKGRVKMGGTFFGEGNGIVYTKVRSRRDSDGDAGRKIAVIEKAGKSARRLHRNHSVLAGQDGALTAGGDGHRWRRLAPARGFGAQSRVSCPAAAIRPCGGRRKASRTA